MKKEDKIALTLLVIFTLGLFNFILVLGIRLFDIFLTATKTRTLYIIIALFAIAIILSSKEKVLKNKYYDHFKKQILLFLRTFKEWKLLGKGIVIDTLTLLSIFLILFLAVRFIRWNFSFFEQIPGLAIATQSYVQTGNPVVSDALMQQLQTNASNIKNALIFSGIVVIAAYLLIISSFSMFQGLLYSKFTKQKFDKKFAKKFLIINLILIPAFTLLIILTGIMVKSSAAPKIIVILLLLSFYLLLISFSLFDKNEKILKMIKSSLNLAFKKIHFFFTPFIIAYTFIIILLFIVGFLNKKLLLPQQALIVVYVSIIIIFITWLKLFSLKVIRGIKNE